MLRIIKEKQKLRKENTDMRKVIEEALQDLLDPECPPGVRILSTSIRLERALENEGEGTAMPERLTRKNSSGTYRVPMATQGELDLKWQQGELNIFGELANRLGQYEDLGTVKELTELKNRIKK